MLRAVEQIDRCQCGVGIDRHRLEDAAQADDDADCGGGVEHAGVVFQSQVHTPARHGLQGQRVVVAFPGVDTGDGQVPCCGQRFRVDRIVLEHEQGVEELLVSREPVDVRQRDMLVVECAGVIGLQLIQQGGRRGDSVDPRPHRHGVDEQPDHRFRSGEIRGPARHCGSEHHVALVGQRRQQNRPGGLQNDVHRGPVRARHTDESLCQVFGESERLDLPCAGAPRGADQRRVVQTGENGTPRLQGCLGVDGVDPAQVSAERRCLRQWHSGVTGEDLPQQHRQRPPVHNDVMERQDTAVLVGARPDQGGPECRWGA
ncbi:hypothetical protein MOBUDSM44075_04209 [Mycolicibacterium obuense]|uniref:Uncharacterized protein n=1 Tax=Mycolicibacterium obuense TaxID=1807 RepID=A0A0J6VPD4_9MYCO|nr:hypothetical protein MOBUDSM44075_04209 [Mycolicibacterium obuense]